MFMKKLNFNNNNSKYCLNCVNGNFLEYTDEIFCTKKGFVDKFSKCLKYKYDPLKRRPEANSTSVGFSEEDFKL